MNIQPRVCGQPSLSSQFPSRCLNSGLLTVPLCLLCSVLFLAAAAAALMSPIQKRANRERLRCGEAPHEIDNRGTRGVCEAWRMCNNSHLCTEMDNKVCLRLRELVPAARGGITQPRTHFFGQLCSKMMSWGNKEIIARSAWIVNA